VRKLLAPIELMRRKRINLNRICLRFALLIGIILFFSNVTRSQSYGLGFNGQGFSKDQRTGIDLSPKGYLSLDNNFELTFKMQLRSNARMYFGYLVRIIAKNETNVDLIFNSSGINSSSIEVVCGQKLTSLSLKADVGKLCGTWTEFRLKFDLKKNIIRLLIPSIGYQGEDAIANMTGEVKILFGTNEFSHYKTADVPSMKIKDICIYEQGKLSNSWPLDESEGDMARDQVQNRIAGVKNPVWLKPEHSAWQKATTATLNGICEIAFNEQDEKVYMIGEEQMVVYSLKDNKSDTVRYKNKAINLLPGRQAFYNSDAKSIVICDVDQKKLSEFDFNTLSWIQETPLRRIETVFLHHNQYYRSADRSVYIFGGYGQHEYKNLVQKSSLSSGTWEILKPTGDDFSPRYLASSGVINDTVFLLGGYGSVSGKQILNPQNFYDLTSYSIKDQKFKKLYDFVPPAEDLCFSNSMVIDGDNHIFYALGFSVIKYEGQLQLVKGSLKHPDLKLIASKIPYLFHDVNSFSTLYQGRSSKKLIAATMLQNTKNQTEFNLYTIAFPPNDMTPVAEKGSNISRYWFYMAGILALLAILFILFRKRFAKNDVFSDHGIGGRKANPETGYSLNEQNPEPKEVIRNTVLFFGGLQVFNDEGVDITNRFSPLVKELFLLIWLHSIKNDKGISSEYLTELLWFDKDEHSANNNRAVNIAKLKQILSEVSSCTLSHKTAYWKIDFDDTILFNDYHECLKITNSKKALSKEKIGRLMELSQKGIFLASANYQWLDDYKDNISNAIIDKLTQFAQLQKTEEDPAFMVHLADSLFVFDIVNEEAMILKCKALTLMGKHSLASHTFSKFTRDYRILYNQNYGQSLDEIISQGIDI
jgi:DNA-binding SARP family transcriptional activator